MSRLSKTLLAASALAPTGVAALATLDHPQQIQPPAIVIQAPAAATPAPAPSTTPGGPAAPAQTVVTQTTGTGASPPMLSDMPMADCLKRFQGIDLPYQRGDGVAANQTIVCRRGYILSFDAATHDPDWVMEHLTPADLQGKAVRSNAFTGDVLLGHRDASNADYAKTGFDRGHQAPAGDAKFDQHIMDQSFFFSNMAPQIGIGFNRGAWKFLEETVRAWVTCGGHPDLYVITGPIYADNPRADAAAIGPDKVAVPVQFFKIVYDPTSGRAVGFVLPNAKIGSRIDDLQTYVKPISYIETETGLNFFRSFTFARQTLLKTQPGVAWGHVGTCTGDAGD